LLRIVKDLLIRPSNSDVSKVRANGVSDPPYYTEAKVALAGEMVMDGGFFNAQRGGNIGITKTVKPLFKEQCFSEI
jgi:hypothetical protein